MKWSRSAIMYQCLSGHTQSGVSSHHGPDIDCWRDPMQKDQGPVKEFQPFFQCFTEIAKRRCKDLGSCVDKGGCLGHECDLRIFYCGQIK